MPLVTNVGHPISYCYYTITSRCLFTSNLAGKANKVKNTRCTTQPLRTVQKIHLLYIREPSSPTNK